MKADLYEQFVSLKNLGKKAEAKVAIDTFIASFESWEEKQVWVYSFLNSGGNGCRIRHEIYENLVYPVLLDGYLKGSVASIVWLARTASNLYTIKSPHALLKHKTDFALFKEAYELEPSEEIGAQLLNALLDWFHFSQHEWPAGILYGMDGANMEQCEEILQEVEFARSLDIQRRYDGYFSGFEIKVHEYVKRLRERA
jgi:hypothetical protein